MLFKIGSLKFAAAILFAALCVCALQGAHAALQNPAEQPVAESAVAEAADAAQAPAAEPAPEQTAEPAPQPAEQPKEKKAEKGYLAKVFMAPFANILFLVFLITVVGYLLGKIEIKGVGLGTAGVFLIALVFGHFGCANDSLLHQIGLVTVDEAKMKTSMKLVSDLGLLCFVTSVGFIAGPKFFKNLKQNYKSYALLGLVIIGTAALTCAALIKFTDVDAAMLVGILSGSLTTTPGFAAANEVLQNASPTLCDAYMNAGVFDTYMLEHPELSSLSVEEIQNLLVDRCTVGHAIGYPFGVVGVVLFVQLVPKLLRADIAEEQKKMQAAGEIVVDRRLPENLLKLDPIGLGPFALAIILGVLLGKVYVPLPGGANFSLGNTGGALIMGLILGHFGRLGPISLKISTDFLKSFREFGLVFFLIGAGVPGGAGFVHDVKEYGFILFVYGAIMELVPMLLGYFVASKIVKLCMLNNLGSITGGMTSTPALGALINTAKTDDVAAAYAATYPVALVLVVLASQFLAMM
ncbi:MAG: hypothetical protein IK077_02085 [Thermoguttaceae bacterium]|nr:hypothetical protein [Thermoguttaceae bacterium]